MATNNFIVSSLPAYVQELEPVLIDQVSVKGPTIDRIAIQTGIKKSANLNYLDVRPVLQNGAGCGFTPQGEVELTDREIAVAVLKINLEICPDKLRGTYAEHLIRTGADADGEELPFNKEITDALVAWIQEVVELAIWQGDTDSADENLANFDGFIKIAQEEAGVIDVAIAADDTMMEALEAVRAKIPAAARKRGAVIRVSPEDFETYMLELVAANLFHYSGPQDEDPTEWTMPGTRIRVVATEGLAGTHYIFATYDRNLYYGTDRENDKEQFAIEYDEKAETFMIKVRWASGVQIAFPDRVVLGTRASE